MQLRFCLALFTTILSSLVLGNSGESEIEKHIEVSLRMIGHQVLLKVGDSSSRVLPIEKVGNQYRIDFENEFAFNPDDIVNTITPIIKDTKIGLGYFLEVVDCNTNKVVYSYEVNNIDSVEIIPCISRDQQKSCYSLLFTLNGPYERFTEQVLNNSDDVGSKENSASTFNYILLLLVVLGGFAVWKFKNRKKINTDLIAIGKYHFDERNLELILPEQKIELTGKEAALLMILYEQINTTVEREMILFKVWGDEGDYIGRTLDVFISKLRKKLEADPNVKILNIRGVGYKLVINN